ncbi:type 1 glutamine amidotransferase [uncultured Jatrophihabitans sp.]|uniref:type 1 glutamine amidotransferase n=1 Tax=uncultured Jatrophihabitans sp. TaxID=1610747 RepID=UPI0035C9E809
MPSSRVLVVELHEDDPVGRLGDWLRDAGLDLDVVRAPDFPDALDGHAGLIVMGGPMGANEDALHPWLPGLRALLRAAVTAEVPTLGVCLGGQLLAAAHGGRVVPSADQQEIGNQLVAKRSNAATDPLFRPLPITPDVIQWHYDAITTLPRGAIHLMNSPVCENQAFRLGRLAWGIQFHIETTPAMVRTWAAHNAEGLEDYDLDAVLARADAVHDDLEEVWRPFADSFAGVVRDPDAVAAHRGPSLSSAAPVTEPDAIRAALASLGAEQNAARSSPLPMPTLRPEGGAEPSDQGLHDSSGPRDAGR